MYFYFVRYKCKLNSKIGDFVILNTGSIIEHECVLGKATSISPGAVLCGNVEVGERVLIGANSVIKEGVKIGMIQLLVLEVQSLMMLYRIQLW